MTDIKEAQGLEIFTVPDWYLADCRKNPRDKDVVLLSDATAVIDQLKAENEVLTLRVMAGERQELAALKSAPVVMPNRLTDGAADYAYARYSAGWNACLDEVTKLNQGVNKND